MAEKEVEKVMKKQEVRKRGWQEVKKRRSQEVWEKKYFREKVKEDILIMNYFNVQLTCKMSKIKDD